MADPTDAGGLLQKALYAILTGATFRTAAGVDWPVYDRVPAGTKPPYIKIGEALELGDNAQGYAGSEHRLTIGFWGPGPGKLQVKAAAAAARAILCPDQRPGQAAPFTLTGHQLVTWTWESTQVLDDTDGVSVKAIAILTYLTYPTA